MKRKALLSVFNKTDDFAGFARSLLNYDLELLASGGTFDFLVKKKLPVQNVADIVGPAILGHRVVTLSREVYAMILARLNEADDVAELEALKLAPIELVYVDMYPLADAIADLSKTADQVNEMIDIGGPNMLRAANKANRVSVSTESQFQEALAILRTQNLGEDTMLRRLRLRAQSERHVANYVGLSATFSEQLAERRFEDWRREFSAGR